MPIKLIPPKAGRSAFYRVRGTYLGTYVDRSTQTSERPVAQKLLAAWKDQIERGAYARPTGPTFASAAIDYMNAGGEARFVRPLLLHFREASLSEIDQSAIDRAAAILYPNATPATRNRQVYSPASAILKRAGCTVTLKRPKGWRGEARPHWLKPPEAFALIEAATEAHPRFGALLTFLLYCGPRLSEALRLRWEDVDLERQTALLRRTKNGSPITVHLPAPAVVAMGSLVRRPGSVFGLSKSGRLYSLLSAAERTAGLALPERSAFHILRHTHATWRRLYTGADTTALVSTGLWKDRTSASVYEHVDVSEEARKSDLLPTRAQRVRLVRTERKDK